MDEEKVLTPDQISGDNSGGLGLQEFLDSVGQTGTTRSRITTARNVHLGEPIENYMDYLDTNDLHGDKRQIDFARADSQSWMESLGRGIASRGLSIIPKTLQGIGHVGGFISSLLPGGDFSDVYDNAWVEMFSKMDEGLKEIFPIYAQEAYSEGSILEQMGTHKFWAEDAFDGAAFMVSAMLPGAAVGKVGSAVLKTTKRLQNLVGGASKADAAVRGFTIGTSTIYNTIST